MKNQLYRCLIIAGIIFSFLIPAGAIAQDRDRTHDRDLIELKQQLRDQVRLSQEEIDAVDPELRECLNLKGSHVQIREMVQAAVQNNCKGTCLGEMLRNMNRAMSRGLSDKEAQEMVTSAMREQIQDLEQKRLQLNDKEFGDRVRERIENRLTEREQMQKRMQEKTMEHEGMHPMDRGMDQKRLGPDGSGTKGSGNGSGKGSGR
ncbi:MAG: hypothetical protein IT393_03140 [Nitrospirae bacterium]|nr:hypothetical protein [Nitrospirota bacterium]